MSTPSRGQEREVGFLVRHPVIPRGYCREDRVEASLNGLVSPGSTYIWREGTHLQLSRVPDLPSLTPPFLEDLQSS